MGKPHPTYACTWLSLFLCCNVRWLRGETICVCVCSLLRSNTPVIRSSRMFQTCGLLTQVITLYTSATVRYGEFRNLHLSRWNHWYLCTKALRFAPHKGKIFVNTSRYNDSLRAGWSSVWTPAGVRDSYILQNVQTGSADHPASCSVGTGFFPDGKAEIKNGWICTSAPPM
jgi:hypothetical protein